MKPTLGIVSLLLAGDYELAAGFAPEDDIAFEECVVHDGGGTDPGVLYLVGEPIGASKRWRGRIVLGLASDEVAAPAVSSGEFHVVVRERSPKKRRRTRDARFIDLANAVNAAIRKYDRWAFELQRCSLGKPDFTEMLRLLETEMGLVSILVDRNLRYLAASDGFAANNEWFNRTDTSMETEMVNQLMADEAFRDAIRRNETFYYHFFREGADQYSACYNVRVGNRYEARLLTQSATGAKALGQFALTTHLGEAIQEAFARYAAEPSDETADPEFLHMLHEVARGAATKAGDLRRALSSRRWAVEDAYRVHVFSFIEPESETVTRRYYFDRIAHLFEGCAAFSHDGLICCVRNLNVARRSEDEAAQDLVLFLRENLCHAGTSRDFHDFRELPAHLVEARCALRLGEESGSMEWHFRFEDYALDYALDQVQCELGWEALVHPAFQALREYDKGHGSELLETARCFMISKYNVTHAAEQLHIHRSSMIARLDRIQEISGIDWDSRDERLHLALSFKLAGM